MKNFLFQHWFRLTLVAVFIGLVTSGMVLYSKQQQNSQLILQKQLELQQRELELKEQTEINKQEQQAQADLKKTQDANKKQLTQQKINSCIISAQVERDRRKNNLRQVWLSCTLDPLFTYDECEKYHDYSDVDDMYKGWEANCERGIDNGF